MHPMTSQTSFRFESGELSFELAGSEEFVMKNLPAFMPLVARIAGLEPKKAESPAQSAEPAPSGPVALKTWWERSVPFGTRVSMQDAILVFALWMRSFKKYIFTSEDIRRGFEEMGLPEPKSLLQILGTLKRDHNLILGTERRGEYMLNTTGIDRARQLLGMPSPGGHRPDAPREDAGRAGEAGARALSEI
jgi:hypothetical protein